ncbi:MAG: TetR/AcrR family transcriptional regulator [Deltaproteobacteria bacterium]|nr:TetR/AcrR family transcriptional regulator [Deltaproteobacteria bacterium]
MSGAISSRARRHRRILESASHVFAENDYAAVSMGAVARRAAVSRGTVYNYFGFKDRLYREVLDLWFGELVTGLEELLAQSRDPVDELERCVLEPLLFFVRFPKVLMLWRREEIKRIVSSNGPVRFVQVVQRLSKLICNVIADGVTAGVFRPVEPLATARAILGAIEGTAGSLVGCRVDDPEVSRAVEQLAEFVQQSLLEHTGRRAG